LLRCTSTFIQEAGPADLRIIAGSCGLHRPFTLQSPRHYDGAIQQDARCLLHGRTSKCLSVSLLLTSQVRHASVCLDATHMPAYRDCHAEEGCDRVVAVKDIYMHSRYACSAFPATCVSATCVSATCVSATWPICPALRCLLRHAWCTVARQHPCGFAAARAAHPSGGSPFPLGFFSGTRLGTCRCHLAPLSSSCICTLCRHGTGTLTGGAGKLALSDTAGLLGYPCGPSVSLSPMWLMGCLLPNMWVYRHGKRTHCCYGNLISLLDIMVLRR